MQNQILARAKTAALSLIHPFSNALVSKSRNVLSDLFDKKYLGVVYHDLLKACEKISPTITAEEVRLIAEDTRSQSKGSSFYGYRTGRHQLAKQHVEQNQHSPDNQLLKRFVTQTFSHLVQKLQNMVVNMKVLLLKLIKRSWRKSTSTFK